MQRLGSSGLRWLQGNRERTTKVLLTLVTADAVARAPLQQMQQFNGRDGCPVCITPSKPVNKDNPLHRFYPLRTNFIYRTQESTNVLAKASQVRYKTRKIRLFLRGERNCLLFPALKIREYIQKVNSASFKIFFLSITYEG